MGKTSQAQLKAIKKYNEKNTRQILMRLNSNTDADIIVYLDQSGNKQGTIKAALREYMKK